MLAGIKKTLKTIASYPPGSRFERMYDEHQAARRSPMARVLYIGLGVVLVVVGIIALPAPGPGTLVLAAAFGLIARESIQLAKFLDRMEVKARALWKRVRARFHRD